MAYVVPARSIITSVLTNQVRHAANTCYYPICGVEVVKAPQKNSEKCRVGAFLARNFFQDEPILAAAGLAEKTPDPAILEFFLHMMHEGKTLYAMVPESRELLGVAVCHTTTPTTVYELKTMADRLTRDKCRRYIHFLAQLEERANLYKTFRVDKALQVDVLCTGKLYRRRGIAKMLLGGVRDMAKKYIEYDIVRLNTGNAFASRAASRCSVMKVWSKKTLSSYKDPRGVPWIKKELCLPHKEVEVLIANMKTEKKAKKKELICDTYGLDRPGGTE